MRALFIAVSLLASVAVHAQQNCTIDIKADDNMRYDQKSVTVSAACPAVTINFAHTGTMPAQMMGHNVVIASTENYQAVVQEGMKAGLASDYVDGSDARVIAHTKIIGGGEKTSVTVPGGRLKTGGDYTFFCTSPGHVSLMRGQVIVK